MSFLAHLHRVADRQDLSCAEACDAMEHVLDGRASPAQIAGFLVALRMKGETVGELVGFARAMRRMAVPCNPGLEGEPLLDTCGTGGDGGISFNISTVAAFVVAGAGVRVAKHGNRSISSQCGSADLLERLGIELAIPPDASARAIREIGIGFLFAPAVHTAMRHAQPVRKELRMRTVFNLLGPLTNPANATAQLAGAPSAAGAELMAGALAELGLRHGFVVHGSDGLDEITTTGPTLAFEICEGSVVRRTLEPADFGVLRAERDDLKGGDPARNHEIALEVLEGTPGPRRDIVLANAAAALVAAGAASDFRQGVAAAAKSIDSGAAARKVQDLALFTTSLRAASE
jgi:anthranilate phosphoribosyltransferase